MVLLGGMLLWILISSSEDMFPRWPRSRSLVWAALSLFILTTGGFVLDRRHLAGQFDNYATRVTTSVGSAIAVNPVVTADSVLFGALVPRFTAAQDGYVIRRLHAGVVSSYGGDGDWFYPASTADDSGTWAEVASKDGSRIIRFDSARLPTSGETLTTEAVTPSNQLFRRTANGWHIIREVRGRGSLWIRRIAERADAIQPSLERELAGPQYDVREAAFSPDAQIIFSSSQPERYHLYRPTRNPEISSS